MVGGRRGKEGVPSISISVCCCCCCCCCCCWGFWRLGERVVRVDVERSLDKVDKEEASRPFMIMFCWA